MRYVGAKRVERAELVRALATADPHVVCQALVDAAFFDTDAAWVTERCLALAGAADSDIANAAIICLGHVARIHRCIDARVVPMLVAAQREERTKVTAGYALDDLRMFAK